MRVLVTRPQPDAARTATRLAALGHVAIIGPLLQFEALEIRKFPAGRFAAVVATSANAMRAVASSALEPFRFVPFYAVGSHTAAAAREAGFENVTDCHGDAAALAAVLAREIAAPARILHLAGEDRAQDLGRLLASSGIEVEVLELYRMRPVERFGTSAALIGSGLDAVLHFSPRSAATFVALAEREGLATVAQKLRHFCLSQAVADALAPLGVTPEIAAQPNEAALFALLKS
jgi:uroporphyrinogen-III synthase